MPPTLHDRLKVAGFEDRFLTLADLTGAGRLQSARKASSDHCPPTCGAAESRRHRGCSIGRAAIAAVMTEDQETQFLAGAAIDPGRARRAEQLAAPAAAHDRSFARAEKYPDASGTPCHDRGNDNTGGGTWQRTTVEDAMLRLEDRRPDEDEEAA